MDDRIRDGVPPQSATAFRPNPQLALLGSLMAIVGILGYSLWAANGGLVKEGNWIGVDFHVYYQAGKALSRGEDIYSAGISPPYVYPPLLAILVWPLSLLNVTAATIVWKALQHICLLAAGWLLVRLLPGRIRPAAAGILFFGWLTAPLQSEIRLGESNSLVLMLTVAALYLIARSKSQGEAPTSPRLAVGAALLLSVAVSIKVLPVLLVAYLWWRGPRKVAALATGGFFALQIVSQVVTPSTARYWFEVFPDLFGQAFPYLDNQSLNAAISRALLPTDPSLPKMQIADGQSLRPILTWAANLLTVGAAIGVLWAAARRRIPQAEGEARAMRFLLEASLVVLTTLLVSGSTWLHQLIALSVPLTALLGAWWLERQSQVDGKGSNIASKAAVPLTLGVAVALLLRTPEEWLTFAGPAAEGSALLALAVSSAATLVVLGLWIVVAATLLRSSTLGACGPKETS